MRFLILIFCLMTASQVVKADCNTTIVGPTAVCIPGLTAGVYTVNFNSSWPCGSSMNLRISPGFSRMTSIVDATGSEFLNGPVASFNIQTTVAYPLTIRVVWLGSGCQSLTATGSQTGIWPWCGCSDTAVMDVLVLAPAPITDIALVGGEPATSCGNITLCATVPASSCAGTYVWNIKGATLTSPGRCINYFLETCPLGTVSASRVSACGTSGTFSKPFTCAGGSANPYIAHEIMACKGRYWSVDVPGSKVSINVLNDSGNTIQQNGNQIFFDPTELGPVVITVTFTICGQEFTQTLFIQVLECGPPIIKSVEEDPKENGKDQNVALTLSSLEAEVYPNPVVDILNIELDHSKYAATIYNLQGQLLMKMDDLAYSSQIDISELTGGVYFITLVADGAIISKKITKQ